MAYSPTSFVVFAASGGAPLAGLFPTFSYFTREAANGAQTDLVVSHVTPSPADKGGGRYEFTVSINDLPPGSGATLYYVIDCGAMAASRYLSGQVDAEEIAAAATTPASIAATDGVTWTADDIASLKQAVASGVLSVRYSGPPERTIVYQSLHEMRLLLAEMNAQAGTAAGTRTGYRLAAMRKGI